MKLGAASVRGFYFVFMDSSPDVQASVLFVPFFFFYMKATASCTTTVLQSVVLIKLQTLESHLYWRLVLCRFVVLK